MNAVFFGSNAYGIQSAARTFFGKLPKDLTIEESALLVGMVNKPTRFNPVVNPELSLKRRNHEIPEDVRTLYKIYRPSPLVRASGLEKALNTPAKIYFKNESVSPVGSHKLNTAIAQCYYNAEQGITHLTTETGAGQWGSAMQLHL